MKSRRYDAKIFNQRREGQKQGPINRVSSKSMEVIMIRQLKNLTIALAVMFLMNGCQAMTGETMGQNLDDGTLTTSVKTSLAGERLNTLSRVGVETNNGIVVLTGEVETASEKSRAGTVTSQVKGVRQVVNNLQVIKR